MGVGPPARGRHVHPPLRRGGRRDLLLHAASVHARRGRRAQRAARGADRARRARALLRVPRPRVGSGGHRRGHRGRHGGGLPAGRSRHRGRRRHFHHRDRAHHDRHLPRGGGRRGQPGRPVGRARPQGRGHRVRQGPRRDRQRARQPRLAGRARRAATTPAPALRLVAGGPRQARPRLGRALLAAPGPSLPGARRAHAEGRRHGAGRQSDAARRAAVRAEAVVIIRRCPRRRPWFSPCWSSRALWPLPSFTRAGRWRRSPPRAGPRCSSRSAR